MKVIGIDQKEYTLNLVKQSKDIEDSQQSILHITARGILKECFPHSKIYEEVILTGCRGAGGTLIADFFIPQLSILIEVHGAQHYKYCKFFHDSEIEFKKYQQNDRTKQEWAKINNITFIELPYNEIKNWKKIINGVIG